MKILITGASRGIGLAEAKKLKANDLYLVANSNKSFKEVDIDAHLLGYDLSNLKEVKALVRDLEKKTNTIDVLVNNVGVLILKKFEKMTDEEIIRELDINLRANILLTKKMLPLLKRSKSPHIVFMSSMAAKSSIVGESVYAATKAAITNFANVLRNELAGKVKVSVMHSWGVNTFGSKEKTLLKPEDIAEMLEFIITRRRGFLVESVDASHVGQWRGGNAPWSPK